MVSDILGFKSAGKLYFHIAHYLACIIEARLESEHPQLPGLSSALSVRSGETSGRFVVAQQRISSGDILAVEPPYTACLLPSKFGSHCHHCFTR